MRVNLHRPHPFEDLTKPVSLLPVMRGFSWGAMTGSACLLIFAPSLDFTASFFLPVILALSTLCVLRLRMASGASCRKSRTP